MSAHNRSGIPVLTEVLVQPLADGFRWFAELGPSLGSITTPTAASIYRYVRSSYPADIVPRIIEYVVLPEPNTYGDDVLTTVQYSKTGACTSLGGHLSEDGHIVWSCYAD